MSAEIELSNTETPLTSAESTRNKNKVKKRSSLRSDSQSSTSSTRVRESEKEKLMLTETEFLHTETPFEPDEKVETRKAVEWLKQQRSWLMQMQQLHGIHATNIQRWLDVFVNECTCRGKQEHASLSDVMQHFNDWLRYKTTSRSEKRNKDSRDEVQNAAGRVPATRNEHTQLVLMLLNNERMLPFVFGYTPSDDIHERLYNMIRSACDGLSVQITNVVEHAEDYSVIYYMRTSDTYSHIKVYIDKNGFVTYAKPMSMLGPEDNELAAIINEISLHFV